VSRAEIPVEVVFTAHCPLFGRFGGSAANDQPTERCQEAGMQIHPNRFPAALAQVFVNLLSSEGDLVLGSNTTERLRRRCIAVESVE
jgi:site-specific DNA-methyltransferase (cytosine-N4-specific)